MAPPPAPPLPLPQEVVIIQPQPLEIFDVDSHADSDKATAFNRWYQRLVIHCKERNRQSTLPTNRTQNGAWVRTLLNSISQATESLILAEYPRLHSDYVSFSNAVEAIKSRLAKLEAPFDAFEQFLEISQRAEEPVRAFHDRLKAQLRKAKLPSNETDNYLVRHRLLAGTTSNDLKYEAIKNAWSLDQI